MRSDLTLTVAAPQTEARLYPASGENRLVRWVSIDDAVTADVPFAVLIRDDVLALDYDEPDSTSNVAEIRRLVIRMGAHPVIVASGQQARRHLFAWIPERHDLLEQVKEVARAGGGDVRTGQWMRPPLAAHRLGMAVRLLEPSTVEDAIVALSSAPEKFPDRLWAPGAQPKAPDFSEGTLGAGEGPRDRHTPRTLSPRMRRLLHHGDVGGVYATRSEVEMALITAFVCADWETHRAFEALTKPEHLGGDKLQEVGGRHGETYAWARFVSQWDKAQRYVIARDSAVTADRANQWTSAMRNIRGRAATSDRLILTAFIERSRFVGAHTINASLRELADEVSITKQTVANAIRRLIRQGYLAHADKERAAADAASYTLIVEALDALAKSLIGPLSPHPQNSASLESDIAISHDAWRNRSGLGKGAAMTYETLGAEPASPTAIAAARGITAPTARRHLRSLQSAGFAELAEQGWIKVVSTRMQMDALAEQMGTLGRGLDQRQRHARERALYMSRTRQRRPSRTDAQNARRRKRKTTTKTSPPSIKHRTKGV